MDVVVYGALCPGGQEHDWGRRLLALALKRELAIGPLPEIACQAGGKPWFPSHPGISFNISHSCGAVVCALHDKPIGVDVEKLRPAPARLAAGRPDEAFFHWWTAAEATLKREGRSALALMRPFEPDPLARHLRGFLPGWITAVCPSEEAPVRCVAVVLNGSEGT